MTESPIAVIVAADAPLQHVLQRLESATELELPPGIALVVDAGGRLIGTISDGDIRRALLRGARMDAAARHFMQRDPITFPDHESVSAILERLPDELASRGRRSRKFLSKLILVDSDDRPTRVLDYHQLWELRVATHRHIVVVGLGYVGLTLALALADEGFLVSGMDVDPERVAMLNSGHSYVHEAGLGDLLERHLGQNLRVTEEMPPDGDVYVISVGTPVSGSGDARTVELDFLHGALDLVGAHLRPGNLVVLRSTVPVGSCSTVAVPRLEARSGLRCGIDFHLAFAPERTAEGRALQELRELPQVIGGFDDESTLATAALFRELTPTIVRVESLEAAEMVKLINNSFRDLVFAFANQTAQVAANFGFDIVEVIRAANQGYPRDPVPLPSPGVGGPCLTKDPYIMAAALDGSPPGGMLSAHGRAVNEGMCDFVARRIVAGLVEAGKDPARCRVLACGLAFKGRPETGDLRDSTGVAIALRLREWGIDVRGFDPVVPAAEIEAAGIPAASLDDGASGADALLLLNNHDAWPGLDLDAVLDRMAARPLVFDGWHQLRAADVLAGREAVYLGLSFTRSSIPDEDGDLAERMEADDGASGGALPVGADAPVVMVSDA